MRAVSDLRSILSGGRGSASGYSSSIVLYRGEANMEAKSSASGSPGVELQARWTARGLHTDEASESAQTAWARKGVG